MVFFLASAISALAWAKKSFQKHSLLHHSEKKLRIRGHTPNRDSSRL
ncbi:MAG: hypothetical protein H6Q48_1023 [Deltaproteobacteria bacterium]|jgi:hypothetical protein|nr:hypothetical protein [Deltaproteobacteria bacterium]